MKKIMLISGTVLLLFLGTQVTRYGNFSQASTQTVQSITVKGKSKTIKLKVTGMTCAGCANHISASLKKLNGVLEHEVKYPGNVAAIKYDPEKITIEKLIAAIEQAGQYNAEIKNSSKEKGSTKKKSGVPGSKKDCCEK